MSEVIECFWLVPTSLHRASLRRWSRHKCPGKPKALCHAKTPLTIVTGEPVSGDLWPHDDIRWPTRCAVCARPFKDYDHWQLFHEAIYNWWGTDIELTLAEAPPGALWDAYWLEGMRKPGADGRYLHVRLPDGKDWNIDGPARGEKDKTKQSWVRTGTVPNITVDPGVRTDTWNGRLMGGQLIENEPPKDVEKEQTEAPIEVNFGDDEDDED